MKIENKIENGYSVYTFTTRKVKYEILTTDGKVFTVYTKRGGYGYGLPTPPRVMKISEMLDGSNKTLKGFAQIVAA